MKVPSRRSAESLKGEEKLKILEKESCEKAKKKDLRRIIARVRERTKSILK